MLVEAMSQQAFVMSKPLIIMKVMLLPLGQDE